LSRRQLGLASTLLLVLAWPGTDAAPAPEGVLAELPFLDGGAPPGELFEGHVRIDLSARPERRPLPMLLDTGAQATMMTPRYARALRVSVRRAKQDYYRRRTVLGRDLQFRIDTRSSDTASRSGLEVGLIGGDFLEAYVIEVDYRTGRVRFLDPEVHAVRAESAAPGELVLPMGFTDGRPTVEIGLGSGSLDFVMDTGAPGGLIISEEKAAELGIAIPPEASRRLGLNLMGRDVRASFVVPSVRLGERVERNVVLGVALRGGSSYRVTNIGGQGEALLGNRFLSRFRVRFDYPNGRVGLLPQVEPKLPAQALAHLPPSGDDDAPISSAIFVPVDLSPARAARTFGQEVWIELDSAGQTLERRSSIPYFDLRGWAGAGQPMEHDVMIVVDTSGSTAVASGSDIDGDGKLGKRSRREREAWRNFNPRFLSSDSGDTVLAAELLATRRLVERMGPGHARIGLMSFSGDARLAAALGADRETLAGALGDLDSAFGSGATNTAAALRLATQALLLARPPDAESRRQSILILSDGYPTVPEHQAEEATYQAALEAVDLGIRIYSFALGVGELQPDDVFVEMALVSGGGHVRLENPAEVVHELARVNLTEVTEIEARNLTRASDARALRRFPDGSFDAFVPLIPGENRIEVTARGDAGGEARVEQLVLYHPTEPSEGDAELEAFRRELKTRTIETLLATRAMNAEEAEREVDRQLEIELEE
jgi:Mg-chelatase subunit ChlD/predicted aspartyl protease